MTRKRTVEYAALEAENARLRAVVEAARAFLGSLDSQEDEYGPVHEFLALGVISNLTDLRDALRGAAPEGA